MIKFICKECNKTLELMRATITIVDGSVITKEAKCTDCNKYMQEYDKDFKGFPNIIRTEPTLNKK